MGGIIAIDRWFEGARQAPSLADILLCISDDGRDLAWTIQELEAFYDLEGFSEHGIWRDTTVLEATITAAPHGLPLSWEDLIALGAHVQQAIWFLATGMATPTTIPKEADQQLLDASTIIVHLHDGTEWQIFSRREPVLDRLSASYGHAAVRREEFMW